MNEVPAWAARLRKERRQRCWSQKDMARELAEAADERLRAHMPNRESLARMIRDWESGRTRPRDPYPVLYARALNLDEDDLFAIGAAAPPSLNASTPMLLPLDGRPADADYVEAIRQAGQQLVALDSLHGGNEVAPLALRIFQTANGKLAAGKFVPAVEHDLEAASGEMGEIAAWQAHDADRQDTSRQVIHEALMLSRMAGDRDMELFELAHLSMLSLCQQRPREALRVADDVLEGIGLPPRVAAVFDVRRGRALACMGEKARAFDAIDRARSALADSVTSRDPNWTWWMDDAELAWHEGMVHAELGEWRQSIPALTKAASHRPSGGRSRFHYVSQLLNALVHAGAWEEAEPVMLNAIEQAAEIGSARTTNLLLRMTGRVERQVGARPTSMIGDAVQDLRRVITACAGPGG